MKKFIFNNSFSNFYIFFLVTFTLISIPKAYLQEINSIDTQSIKNHKRKSAQIFWKKKDNINEGGKIIWNKLDKKLEKKLLFFNNENLKEKNSINSLNRSIVINNQIGPDISWLVPPGFMWTKKYSFDGSIRGFNRREEGESFFKINDGDAVGQFYLKILNNKNSTFGLNLGMRSVTPGGYKTAKSPIGDGLSAGFRYDKSLSSTSGLAIGAEQLLHFDEMTDTGRDIYVTLSKGWFNKNNNNGFPLNTATIGIGTGKLAEGNIKGLCSGILGGSGTELVKRPLCWAPIFSLSRVYNKNFSTFFEYNSKFFILGTSISPLKETAIRGTFGIILSDHIDNYKMHEFQELRWVFRLNYGF